MPAQPQQLAEALGGIAAVVDHQNPQRRTLRYVGRIAILAGTVAVELLQEEQLGTADRAEHDPGILA